MAGSARHADRLRLGVGAVLTVAEAAALLPVADRDARSFLRRKGLVRDLDGRAVVRWLDVLDALAADAGPASPAPSLPAGPPLRRARLDPI